MAKTVRQLHFFKQCKLLCIVVQICSGTISSSIKISFLFYNYPSMLSRVTQEQTLYPQILVHGMFRIPVSLLENLQVELFLYVTKRGHKGWEVHDLSNFSLFAESFLVWSPILPPPPQKN
ncbi:E3 ubiquitin-protein ligase RNF43 [Platysternon megacephalum]|uniref:E3 ubiquitin-protein ligase RNF43 n=1 Tax=Platysternon megacephalum TaxID=55544 RepID=A0A4D9DJ82_9SAUR|nr:thiosulfate sulfurtransferase [Platysternon megacephalum]TFK00824.1 E3 ubiquitin-protein ligase RNF43 [Platysternon megacephalum]